MVGIEKDKLVTEFALNQNYPNPFNPTTIIKYDIPRTIFVEIRLYDLLGREVMKLVNEEKSPGRYQVELNGEGLSSGAYFYHLKAGEFSKIRKLVFIK